MSDAEAFSRHVDRQNLSGARVAFKELAVSTTSFYAPDGRAYVMVTFKDRSAVSVSADSWAWVRGW